MVGTLLVVIFMIALLVTSFQGFTSDRNSNTQQPTEGTDYDFTTYSSPDCGCCGQFVNYLRDLGYSVNSQKANSYRNQFVAAGVPEDMYSCHISFIDGYYVVGHVPIEAIIHLLNTKPAIDGISLPGMPTGSPGMGGIKSEEFIIYSINNGEVQEFFRI